MNCKSYTFFHVFVTGVLLVLCFQQTNAQAPQGMNYQGVVRDSNGAPLKAGIPVSLRFTIHDSSSTGTEVFTETSQTTTNQFGLVTTVIGNSGNLATINWGNGAKYLEVEVALNGSSTYTDMGTTQLVSVPYALYAANSNSGPPGATGDAGPTGPSGATGPPEFPVVQGPPVQQAAETAPLGLPGHPGQMALRDPPAQQAVEAALHFI